jgi:O-antigen/teichoic acid export membrane protein
MKTSIKKNAIANYIGQFYSVVIAIIILPLYLRYLGAEAYVWFNWFFYYVICLDDVT